MFILTRKVLNQNRRYTRVFKYIKGQIIFCQVFAKPEKYAHSTQMS